jgi:undecaprenyl-diphosphatase
MKRNTVGIVLVILILFVIGTWVIEIMNGKLPYVDQWTRVLVERFNGTHVYTFLRGMTELGSSSFLIPFIVVMTLVLWWVFHDYVPAIIFAGGMLLSHLLNTLIKSLVARERPSISVSANAEGFSFPSGHAMMSMVCYGLLAYFISKKIRSTYTVFLVQVSCALLVFLIGLSRFFINVHYLTDIMAGFFLGFVCLIGLISLYEWIRGRQSQT